jgi:hypothetical protein
VRWRQRMQRSGAAAVVLSWIVGRRSLDAAARCGGREGFGLGLNRDLGLRRRR